MQLRMNKIAIGAGLLVLAAGAVAQEPMKPVGLSLRAGLFMPTDAGTRATGNGWFAAGVDYKVFEREGMMSGQADVVSVSLDYSAKNNYRIVPLLVNFTRHQGSVYFSVGAGVSFSRRPFGAGIEDRTRFGYTAAIGYEFATTQFPLFLEGRFLGNEKSEFNGFAVYAGARF